MATIAFTGQAWSSQIEVSAAPQAPADVAAAWLEGAAAVDYSGVDDGCVLFVAPSLGGAARMGLSSEGALEWYAGLPAAVGSVALTGISRMYLATPLAFNAYALVFHPQGLDCGTKSTRYVPSVVGPAYAAGGIGHYSDASVLIDFAARAGADGALTVYLRANGQAQQARLFERSASGAELQNVLLADLPAGQTVRLDFAPSPAFQPYVAPLAAPLGAFITFASAPATGATGTRLLTALFSFRDVAFGGGGTLRGNTRIKGAPANVPVSARVTLLEARSKVVARQVWSDAATGEFVFTGLDTRQQFIALAEYPDGSMRPVAGVSAVEAG